MKPRWLICSIFMLAVLIVIGAGAVSGIRMPAPAQIEPAAQGTPLALAHGVAQPVRLAVVETCRTITNSMVLHIPDNDPVGISSSIAMGSTDYVTAITITASISHTYPTDLSLSFCLPGRTCVLEEQEMDKTDCDNCILSFNDNAPGYLRDAAWPYGGVYKPDSSGDSYSPYYSPLVLFGGQRASGVYTFKAIDNWAADVGTINGWSLTICTSPVPITATPLPAETSTWPTDTPRPTAIQPTPYQTPSKIYDCYYENEWSNPVGWSESGGPNTHVCPGDYCNPYSDGQLCIYSRCGAVVNFSAYAEADGGGASADTVTSGSGCSAPVITSETYADGQCLHVTSQTDCTAILPPNYTWLFTSAAKNAAAVDCGNYSRANLSLSATFAGDEGCPYYTPFPTTTPYPTVLPTTPVPVKTPCTPVPGGGAWFIW